MNVLNVTLSLNCTRKNGYNGKLCYVYFGITKKERKKHSRNQVGGLIGRIYIYKAQFWVDILEKKSTGIYLPGCFLLHGS